MGKILLVDDEPGVLKILKINLELDGQEVFLAADGATALRRIEMEQPDLVLLDIMMPVLDGWEVLRRLNMLHLRKWPRVIVMTAKAGAHDVDKGLLLGADRYITKPFEIDELVDLIHELLQKEPEKRLAADTPGE